MIRDNNPFPTLSALVSFGDLLSALEDGVFWKKGLSKGLHHLEVLEIFQERSCLENMEDQLLPGDLSALHLCDLDCDASGDIIALPLLVHVLLLCTGRHRKGRQEGELLKDLHTDTGFLRTLPPPILKKPLPLPLTKQTFLRTLPLFLRTLLLFLRASMHLPDSHRVTLSFVQESSVAKGNMTAEAERRCTRCKKA